MNSTAAAALTDELLALGTATLFEASGLDCDLDPDLRPAWPGARLAGTALPVQAAAGDNLPLHWALEDARPGDVLVVDGAGARFGYWGEILAVAAMQRGVRGLVIDGGVRDTTRLAELGFPVFASSIAIRGTVKRWRGSIGTPITLHGKVITRGDTIVADADGVVAVPAAELDRTIVAARARAAAEQGYLERLRRGEPTLDVYGLR